MKATKTAKMNNYTLAKNCQLIIFFLKKGGGAIVKQLWNLSFRPLVNNLITLKRFEWFASFNEGFVYPDIG